MKIKYILTILVAGLLVGCSFLDEYTQDKFKPSTTSDFDAILIEHAYSNHIFNAIPYYDLLTDDVSTYDYDRDKEGMVHVEDIERIRNCNPFYTWEPKMYEITKSENKNSSCNSWEGLYKLIMNCNVVLGNIDGSIGTVEAKGYLKAQALILRAYYYYYLINLYSEPFNSGNSDNDPYASGNPARMKGVPFINDFNVSESFPKPNSVEEVYEFIFRDINESIDLFAKYIPAGDQPVQRATIATAHGLATRMYMHMNNWDKVIEHSKEVFKTKNQLDNLSDFIGSNGLISDMGDVNRPYSTEDGNLSNEYIFGCFRDGSGYKEKFFMDADDQQQILPYAVSQELMNLYETTFTYKTTYDSKNPSVITSVIQEYLTSGDLRYIHYYHHRDRARSEINTKYSPFYGIKTDAGAGRNFLGIRTAEIYLNYAEALIRKGDIATAFDQINFIREHRWFGTYTEVADPVDKTAALEYYMEERRRELSFEHIRWFDIRRLGIEIVHEMNHTGGQSIELKKGDERYTLPIPKEVTDRNPELLIEF